MVRESWGLVIATVYGSFGCLCTMPTGRITAFAYENRGIDPCYRHFMIS